MNNVTNTWRSLFFIAALFISTLSFGQKKTTKKSSSGSSGSTSAGTIGIGIKGGDPTGLTAKFYRSSLDIELVVGRPYYFSHHYYDDDYYYDRFYKYDKYRGYYFDRYESTKPVALQLHFLKSKGTKSAKELKWYYGGGPQFRTYKVNYYYRQYYGPKGNDYVIVNDKYTYYDLGLDGVIGLEYTFSDLPISLFADANLFLELVDEITLSPQGGLGVRFNIK